MPIASFEALYRGICAELGASVPPELAGEGHFALQSGALEVMVRSVPMAIEPTVLVSIDLGPLPAAREQDLARDLMTANFLLIAENAPAFGRDATNGHVVLMCRQVLSQVDLPQVTLAIAAMVQAATGWAGDLAAETEAAKGPVGQFA